MGNRLKNKNRIELLSITLGQLRQLKEQNYLSKKGIHFLNSIENSLSEEEDKK